MRSFVEPVHSSLESPIIQCRLWHALFFSRMFVWSQTPISERHGSYYFFHATLAICSLLPARALHVSQYIHHNIPLNWGTRQHGGFVSHGNICRSLPSCPGNGWCARWWPWMYLPYLTRPELCVWRSPDVKETWPICCYLNSAHAWTRVIAQDAELHTLCAPDSYQTRVTSLLLLKLVFAHGPAS